VQAAASANELAQPAAASAAAGLLGSSGSRGSSGLSKGASRPQSGKKAAVAAKESRTAAAPLAATPAQPTTADRPQSSTRAAAKRQRQSKGQLAEQTVQVSVRVSHSVGTRSHRAALSQQAHDGEPRHQRVSQFHVSKQGLHHLWETT
jgi:hypothetical protein